MVLSPTVLWGALKLLWDYYFTTWEHDLLSGECNTWQNSTTPSSNCSFRKGSWQFRFWSGPALLDWKLTESNNWEKIYKLLIQEFLKKNTKKNTTVNHMKHPKKLFKLWGNLSTHQVNALVWVWKDPFSEGLSSSLLAWNDWNTVERTRKLQTMVLLWLLITWNCLIKSKWQFPISQKP